MSATKNALRVRQSGLELARDSIYLFSSCHLETAKANSQPITSIVNHWKHHFCQSDIAWSFRLVDSCLFYDSYAMSCFNVRAQTEMQRRREISIVEKILAEERALAARKKQQPHLFVDRIKESYKVH